MSTKSLARRSEFLPEIFNDFFKPWNGWFDEGFLGKTMTVPAVNIVENDKEFKLDLAVPGMKKENIKIDVEGNMLTISAETESKKEEEEEKYTRKEYNYSSFTRTFTIPDGVNKEKIDAMYKDGVLNLILPKTEEAKKLTAKKIALK